MKRWLAFLKEMSKKSTVRIVVTMLILGLLLIKLPLAEMADTIAHISFTLWGLVLAMFVMGHVVGALKWRIWINTGKIKVPLMVALRAHFAGLFANLFLPSLAGGDFFRAGIAIRYSREKEEGIFGTVLDRFIDMIALGLIILVGLYLAPEAMRAEDRTLLFWVFRALTAVALGIILLVLVPLPGAIPAKVRQTILRIRAITYHLLKHPFQTSLGFALSIVIQGGFVLLGALLARDCGIDLPISAWFFAWPLAKLFAMLPLSMGGIGVREVALATVLTRFGIPFAKSVSLGLVWESILIVGGCLGGVFYYYMSRSAQPLTNLKIDATDDVRKQLAQISETPT